MTLLHWVPITQNRAQHRAVKPLLWRFRLLVWDVGPSSLLVSVRVEDKLCSAECLPMYVTVHSSPAMPSSQQNTSAHQACPGSGEKNVESQACKVSFVILMKP